MAFFPLLSICLLCSENWYKHKNRCFTLKYNVFDEIIWKTGSQCLSTGMTSQETGMTPSCPVHVAINIKRFTKQKKGKRSPSHCLFSVFGVF
ncbi:hypothetical protein [Wolbachia endosymbiont of Psylliodes chrysocephala]|uniref:hypothetical protein n=1 Tax=Wolbachia endosymbiont of Psylliodes chrysocephala TaxID=2883236 RepID=UPI00209C8091|nr:hypothetical protein [Wolbachia endosymbiont of Psylliodes chrysocephala]